MCLFIESIRIENGTAHELELHNRRMNRTRRHFWPQCHELDLHEALAGTGIPAQGLYKCRVLYGETLQEVQLAPYTLRPVRTLRMVQDNTIDYAFKSTDRSAINRLYDRKGTADDILIVRNGCLTDTSIGNIALFDGHKWVTPDRPLLKGVRRERLLADAQLVTGEISLEDVWQYSSLRIFNAMIGFGTLEIPIDRTHILG